ncbi:MAG: efflux RND transporter periplasmic adaptor subunit [Planctomycetota bacterium]
MLELVFGTFGLAWWLIFKKFKLLPINLWTVVTSIFIVLGVIFFGVMMLSRYQPMTSHARTYAITTPIVAEVQGLIEEVHVTGGEMLEAGDPLVSIGSELYEDRAASLEAEVALAEERLKRVENAAAAGATNALELAEARAAVASLRAELGAAAYQVERTTITAPARGRAVQVTVRPGQFVAPVRFSQVMVFEHDEGPYLVAGFRQTEIEHIDPGDRAEVAFDALPGRVFDAEVTAIQPLIAEGTLSASGSVASFNDLWRRGRIPVLLTMADAPEEVTRLPAGSGARIAVYTGKRTQLNIARQIILRIKSWENWVPLHVGFGD